MNWLSHIFLSDNHIEYQHGNLLADLLKGRAWDGATTQFKSGMRMHRRIDAFTDAHPFVRRSKSRLGSSGRLRGVVIDITYDHLLSLNWLRYSSLPLPDFIANFNERSKSVSTHYPDSARRFIDRLIATNHLTHYGSYNGLEEAFTRLDRRASARLLTRESCTDYLPRIKDQIEGLREDFLGFMPQVIRHFKSHSGLSYGNHWLR